MQRFDQRVKCAIYLLLGIASSLIPLSFLSAQPEGGIVSTRLTNFSHRFTASSSLSAIFAKHALSDDDFVQLLAAGNTYSPLLSLKPEQSVSLSTDIRGRLSEFRLTSDNGQTILVLKRTEKGFESVAENGSQTDAVNRKSTFTPPLERYHKRTEVASGDSLYSIFKQLPLPQTDLAHLVKSGQHGKKLRAIQPSQILKFRLLPEGQLEEMLYEVSPFESILFVRHGNTFQSKLITREAERHIKSASGQIDDSLYTAATAAGLSDKLTINLEHLFAWDIDFAKEIRSGSTFSVVYETYLLDGEVIRIGDILAAQLTNQEQIYHALRFTYPDGRTDYFTPKGEPLRRTFTRSPISSARISSKFNLRRRHPILHKIRAHRGVDYAAPIGTPVKATGDGRVIKLGRKGGYGRTVVIKHGGSYSTLYAHLNKFVRKLRVGSRVKQGQIIGYVGRSGLATGPHLHYEFRVNGVHRNPLTVPLPRASALARKYRSEFKGAHFVEHLL